MFYLQLFVPAGLVLVLLGLGHSFVRIDYSGVYWAWYWSLADFPISQRLVRIPPRMRSRRQSDPVELSNGDIVSSLYSCLL